MSNCFAFFGNIFQQNVIFQHLDSLVSRIFLTPQRKGRKVEGGAKLNPQSRRGCKATPATLRGVQSYPCKVEGGARLPPQRRGGCKVPPQGFRGSGCRNGQFDAMHSSFENMHTFSLVVILRAYLNYIPNFATPLSFARVTLHPSHLCGGNFAPPMSSAGVPVHPLLLCGFNFAPTLSLRG